jgi:putative nucleotidyltransferase with HDIG domain
MKTLRLKSSGIQALKEMKMEVWLIACMLLIAVMLNFLVASSHVLLGLYTLPTLFSAYFYGRRHATLTALLSVTLVVLSGRIDKLFFRHANVISSLPAQHYTDLIGWAGTLLVTAYAMGTLHENEREHLEELRTSYQGVLMILRHFISKDKYTENHSYRVSIYAMKIACCLGLSPDRVEDVRGAALLHDIGKLKISRELLYKAARLTEGEVEQMKNHVHEGVGLLEPVGGTLHRILPIILAHHDKFDGSGYHHVHGEGILVEARIISVADVYDSLTSDRPYRKAMSPFDAREIILKGSGKDFDPEVVEAFSQAFDMQEMEVPEFVV